MTLIKPNEIVITPEGNYWNTDKLYLPEEKEDDVEVLSPEEAIVQEIAGSDKVVSEKKCLAVVRDSTLGEKVKKEVVGTLKNLAKPRNLAYAAGVACTVLAPVVYADEAPVEPPKELKAKGSVELIVGHEASTIDSKLMIKAAPRTSVFARFRPTFDYEGEIKPFHYFTVNLETAKGLHLAVGSRGAGEMKAQAGLMYVGKWGDFSLVQNLLLTIEEHPQLLCLTNLEYTPGKDDWRALMGAENVSLINFGGPLDTHGMSTQRLRAGAKYQNLAFGAAGDLVELGNNGLFSYNIGAFLRAGFVSFEQLLKGGE